MISIRPKCKFKQTMRYLLGSTLLLSFHAAHASSIPDSFLGDITQSVPSHLFVHTAPNEEVSIMPGSGYYSWTQMPVNFNCLENADSPDNISYGNPSGENYINQTVDFEKLESVLNTKIQGKGGYGLFRVSAASSYLKDSQETRYSQSFNYFQSSARAVSYKQPSFYGKDNLSPAAQQAFAIGSKEFIDFCGDSYIVSANAGAVLAISVNVNFHSTTDKENFSRSVGGRVLGVGRITDAVQSAINQYHMQGDISVHALQLGGDPSRLPNMFTKGADGYYFLNCDFSNLADCNRGINGIVDYGKDDFSNQIKFEGGKPVDPSSLYYFSIQGTKEYRKLGITLSAPDISDSDKERQVALTTWYEQDNNDLVFVNHFLNSEVSPHFQPETTQMLRSIKTNLEHRLADYAYVGAADACWGTTPILAAMLITVSFKIEKSITL